MQSQDYDNPKVEAHWLREQRAIVEKYLHGEEIRLVGVMENPIWFIAPYVALWKTSELNSGKQKDLWVISGDLPTDYVELSSVQPPREALLCFAKHWKAMSKEMLKGNFPKSWRTGRLEDQKDLGDLLERRANILLDWAADDQMWQ